MNSFQQRQCSLFYVCTLVKYTLSTSCTDTLRRLILTRTSTRQHQLQHMRHICYTLIAIQVRSVPDREVTELLVLDLKPLRYIMSLDNSPVIFYFCCLAYTVTRSI